MLQTLTDNELRNLCREKLESLEHWLRRLIDETLSDKYDDYFLYVDDAGNRLIRNSIVKSLDERVRKEPERYKRKIDAVLLDDAIDIICNPRLYKEFFQPALENAFPEGADEARTFLKRLLDPRNRLAHANSISLRQTEQVICYSNDIIDSIKAYYVRTGMQQEYNVPLILKVTDSFGNVFHRNEIFDPGFGYLIKSLKEEPRCFLRPGDILTVEVEVDPAFDQREYAVRWTLHTPRTATNSLKMAITITEEHVGEQLDVECHVSSTKGWHRLGVLGDDLLNLCYKVLPP